MSTNTSSSKVKHSAGHGHIFVSFVAIVGGLLLGNQLAKNSMATPDYGVTNDIGMILVFLALGFGLERLMELWAEVSIIPGFGGHRKKAIAEGDAVAAVDLVRSGEEEAGLVCEESFSCQHDAVSSEARRTSDRERRACAA